MKEIREKARELMKGYCRVCAVCNGKVCVGEVPGMGGLGTGSSFHDNVNALSELKFNMRTIHDVEEPVTSVELLGMELDIPVLAAPIGGVKFNMGGGIGEDEYCEAIISGCAEKGIVGCTGDGVPDFIHESAFAAIKAENGRGIPFIKPWEDDELFDKMSKAADTGCTVMGVDVDTVGLVTLRKMGRPVTPKPVDKLKDIIGRTDCKFIVKGIMTADEARMAIDAGADAIVVSNHGGRVLDHCPGTARVLADVAKAVNGEIPVLADGGIRSGADVLKMLALGADAVMVGRPFSMAALGGKKDGVKEYIDTLKGELVQAMVLTGTATASEVSRDILWNK